jgi:hypothetical protein
MVCRLDLWPDGNETELPCHSLLSIMLLPVLS